MLRSIRLSHFDSPGSLNCSVNLAAALSCLTYWSPESVLRVLCPTNRLLCPPSSPHSLSTRSDRPVMMIPAPSPLPPAPQVPNYYLISSTHYHMQIQQSATDERRLYFLFSKVIKIFSMDFFCKQTQNECYTLTHSGSFHIYFTFFPLCRSYHQHSRTLGNSIYKDCCWSKCSCKI